MNAPPEHIMQFFQYDHLPPALAEISEPFGVVAKWIVKTVPRNPERTVALRKLLEAKDAAVRAFKAGPHEEVKVKQPSAKQPSTVTLT